ncbi:formyltetrahydrofolate hydrolase [Legionella gratiana]|uniref:Formyltetrahydrofolate deformylase n=1 Tax=Legionella gratiana TaxID=45066 RepID=A0A378J505_9GAMM|nr:formyltetrahydrofolate deformylase [Legionella gratiana]KTD14501.1 formyltetrahydrofolate hydrolase [Legionella gratiana]STX41997.1 formyltetrahydrofolate hydrolase [Legionella gratiana]
MNQYRILIQAPDRAGLVYKAAKIFYGHGLNIISNNEFVDNANHQFFMRTVVAGNIDVPLLYGKLVDEMPQDTLVTIKPPHKKNIVLMATKEAHVLGDILIRYQEGLLDANILGILSNHNVLFPLCSHFDIPYYHISADHISREEHEAQIIHILKQFDFIDYIVLAKYMRILTPNFTQQYQGKIINIHHSFLPAFIGANPYKQAYDRGVKIIGATAHFVNENLDEGPIIEQDVIHVDHAYDWQSMQQYGRDVEKVVLARALKLALEDRIFVYGNKTVIF